MVIFTGPDGDNFCFTTNNNPTNTNVINRKATTVTAIVPPVLATATIILTN